jgi:phospho-N-acetylmuramoyl-pentapeptide-transferase
MHSHIIFIIQNLVLFIVSFGLSLLLTPFLIRFLYRAKAWKKKAREETFGGYKTPIFTRLHSEKETSTPRMGGIVIWGTVILVIALIALGNWLFPGSFFKDLNFLSRSQTWLPIFALISASLLGLVDDILVVQGKGPAYIGGGIRFKVRLALIVLIAALGAWWFYFKLGWSSIYVPFLGNFEIDGLYMLLFIIVVIATYSSSVVDGLDGLSGGVLVPIFTAYGVIAYSRGYFDLVAFITVIIGALITFLWYNIHPAKFYMTETGIMGLTVTLAVIAFLTNSVLFLPIIAFVLVAESASVILQLFWRKVFKRKLILSAPIHHHFQAIGWPESQITMRFWIISSVCSALGLVVFFLARLM